MATYRLRDCAFCSKSFQPTASHSRHCSPECRFRSITSTFAGDGCWEWPLSNNVQTGYGQFMYRPRPNTLVMSAHRLSYSLLVGHIPNGLCVMHKCDNRSCFNPSHLTIGTFKDNNRDMVAKGRHWWGEKYSPVSHCLRGHEKRRRPNGKMRCPTCAKAQKGQTTSRNRTPP